MRVPFTKPYRAFAEFDALPDEECERLMIHVRARAPATLTIIPLALTVLVAIGWPVGVIVWTHLDPRAPHWLRMPAPMYRPLWFGITTIVLAAAAYLTSRDWALYAALRREVHRARCSRCGYALLGVPIEDRGFQDRDPSMMFVRCPECGRKASLLDLGLTARDLIPFEFRVVPPDAGRLRTPPRPGPSRPTHD